MDSIKILMVDDESRMRKLVKDFLTREGYMVLEAGDGEQALDIFMNDKNIAKPPNLGIGFFCNFLLPSG